jgi:ribonuclease HI
MSQWTLYFDGLCEPKNPGGVMAWGWRLMVDGMERETGHGSQPAHAANTNNTAEWYALGCGLKRLLEMPGAERPESMLLMGDSQLVVKQLTGEWSCNQPHLQECRTRCEALLKLIGVPWEAQWIPRHQNADADALSRVAYKQATGKEAPSRTARGR